MSLLGLLGFAFLVWLVLGLIGVWFDGPNAARDMRAARIVVYFLAIALIAWCLFFHGTLLNLPRG